MRSTIHHKLTVQPGGKIELTDPQLLSGLDVDVYVVVPEIESPKSSSALEVLAQALGHRIFQTAEEVEQYIHTERDAWDR